jgi:hypothetical protein
LFVFSHGNAFPQVHGEITARDSRSLYVGDAGVHIIDAATRLLELMAQPVDAEILAPLVRDEILIRRADRSGRFERAANRERRCRGYEPISTSS